MSRIVTESTSLDIVRGASVFSTGGGIPFGVQVERIYSLFRSIASINLLDVDDLNYSDHVCTIYGVGPASKTDIDLSKAIQKGLEKMESIVNQRFVAIFAGETGIESLVFQSATDAGLHILDADCTGGRAVPEIQFDNLFVAGKSILPMVVATPSGEIKVLRVTKDKQLIEKFVSNIVISTKNSVAVIDHPISAKYARQFLTLGVFERSKKVGIFLKRNKGKKNCITNLAQFVHGRILFKGKISAINLKDDGDFLEGYIEITSRRRQAARVYVKNESLILWINNMVTLTPPDLLTLIDKEKFHGLHNSEIQIGQDVAVLGIPAVDMWRSVAGMRLFNPRKFGFNMEVKLL